MRLQRFLCLIFGHDQEHGTVLSGRWIWTCDRCGKIVA